MNSNYKTLLTSRYRYYLSAPIISSLDHIVKNRYITYYESMPINRSIVATLFKIIVMSISILQYINQ